MVVLVLLMVYLFFIKGYDNSYEEEDDYTESLSASDTDQHSK